MQAVIAVLPEDRGPDMVASRLKTADDLLELSADRTCELIRGEIVDTLHASDEHGAIAFQIARRIILFLGEDERLEGRFADTGFIVQRDPDTVLAPDVAFVDPSRLDPNRNRTGFVSGAPDLVVEVISPSDQYNTVNDKVLLYLEAGAQLVWVVDPKRRTVATYGPDRIGRVLVEDETLDGGGLLPGFSLPVSEIFV